MTTTRADRICVLKPTLSHDYVTECGKRRPFDGSDRYRAISWAGTCPRCWSSLENAYDLRKFRKFVVIPEHPVGAA